MVSFLSVLFSHLFLASSSCIHCHTLACQVASGRRLRALLCIHNHLPLILASFRTSLGTAIVLSTPYNQARYLHALSKFLRITFRLLSPTIICTLRGPDWSQALPSDVSDSRMLLPWRISVEARRRRGCKLNYRRLIQHCSIRLGALNASQP